MTATGGLHDCGSSGNDTCTPLSATEARTHFGAWCIVSSPLVLGFDLRDETQRRRHWDTITNTDAIEVNQDYAGHSGSRFAASDATTLMHGCDWKAGVTCEWESWMAWHKPLSGRDSRGSRAAVLLMNNADGPATLSFKWSQLPVPPLLGHPQGSVVSCLVYDVWQRRSLGRVSGEGFVTAGPIPSRDSAFVTLSGCETARVAARPAERETEE